MRKSLGYAVSFVEGDAERVGTPSARFFKGDAEGEGGSPKSERAKASSNAVHFFEGDAERQTSRHTPPASGGDAPAQAGEGEAGGKQWSVLGNVVKIAATFMSHNRIDKPASLKFAPAPGHPFPWGGVVDFLATRGGRTPRANPADLGLVRLTASSEWVLGRAENSMELDPRPSQSRSEAGGWLCVELKDGVSLWPTHYAIRHGLVGHGFTLRHWQLVGSHDGMQWVTLKRHDNDWTIMSAASSSDPFKVGGCDCTALLSTGILALSRWFISDRVCS